MRFPGLGKRCAFLAVGGLEACYLNVEAIFAQPKPKRGKQFVGGTRTFDAERRTKLYHFIAMPGSPIPATEDLKMSANNDIDSRVERILAKELEVKQLRVDAHARKIDVGFYNPPSLELFQRVETQVRREFDGQWEISVQPNAPSPLFHRHRINDHITEFHRAHPAVEPRLIWKRIPLPKWRNRPVPPVTIRDYRIMLALVGTCGISALAGFALQRAAYPG